MRPLQRSHLSVVTVLVVVLMVLAACGEDEVEFASDGATPEPTQAAGMVASPTASQAEVSIPSPGTGSGQVALTGEPEDPAPELHAGGTWYNSEPLTLAELRGEPVLLVFWATY